MFMNVMLSAFLAATLLHLSSSLHRLILFSPQHILFSLSFRLCLTSISENTKLQKFNSILSFSTDFLVCAAFVTLNYILTFFLATFLQFFNNNIQQHCLHFLWETTTRLFGQVTSLQSTEIFSAFLITATKTCQKPLKTAFRSWFLSCNV